MLYTIKYLPDEALAFAYFHSIGYGKDYMLEHWQAFKDSLQKHIQQNLYEILEEYKLLISHHPFAELKGAANTPEKRFLWLVRTPSIVHATQGQVTYADRELWRAVARSVIAEASGADAADVPEWMLGSCL